MDATPLPLLLSQVGALVSDRWAARLKEVDITPSEGIVLRLVGAEPSIGQSELAARMGIVSSRVVAVVDGLERKAMITRIRSTSDRRRQELELTSVGRQALRGLRDAAAQHEEEVLAPLGPERRESLRELLEALANGHGLQAGSHPRAGRAC